MKLDKSKIYLATLNQAKNYTGYDTDFENPKYETVELYKDQIVVQIAEDLYVPVFYINNLLSMLTLKLSLKFDSVEKNDKLISTRPNGYSKSLYFLSDVRKLKYGNDKISLSQLKQMQRDYDMQNYLSTIQETDITI